MELFDLENLLHKINGCTFANLDAVTEPSRGIRKVTTGERVILFTNKKTSGYENMVRRRLEEAGKDPDSFVLGDLPWGERVPETPLIAHKGLHYLQCVRLIKGQSKFFYSRTGREILDPANLGLRERRTNQGLPPSEQVEVECYKLENITRIALLGEVLVLDDKRAILPLSA